MPPCLGQRRPAQHYCERADGCCARADGGGCPGAPQVRAGVQQVPFDLDITGGARRSTAGSAAPLEGRLLREPAAQPAAASSSQPLQGSRRPPGRRRRACAAAPCPAGDIAAQLDAAAEGAAARGSPIRALLLTNPSNPLGARRGARPASR
jgi:hypothetical protein